MITFGSLSAVLDAAERSGMLNLDLRDIHERLPGVSSAALHQALYRQQRRGRVVRISRGSDHWLIVPLQYAAVGAPPLGTWLDRYLRKTLGISYYVTLLSAAETQGASPHAVMVTQVMVLERRRPITVGRHKVVFHTRTRIDDMPTRWHETPDGRLRVATPELTALELVERATLVGGLARAREVLQALVRSCTPQGLIDAMDALQEIPTAQRLGALLVLDDQRALATPIADWLRGKPLRLIPLDRAHAQVGANEIDPVFKVRLDPTISRANA